MTRLIRALAADLVVDDRELAVAILQALIVAPFLFAGLIALFALMAAVVPFPVQS